MDVNSNQNQSPDFPDTEGFELASASESRPEIRGYVIRDRIAEGGMGSVWLAEQIQPVRRQVAIKVIKADISSKEVVNRFEAERQALAMMSHPNVAQVFDAGATDRGEPYFAMEFVDGVPITEFCDQQQLSIRDRLMIFIGVCAGVQHAHQKGIIHRDLKPSNILVQEIDGHPVPKVIDFGLAKAIDPDQRLSDTSQFTRHGRILGTFKYMSPEQASLDSSKVDTRTDIYALGVVLYELLTGMTPLDDDTVEGLSDLELLNFIREFEPPKPSRRISSQALALDVINNRQIDSKSLNRILAGELDWVVLMALNREPEKRYETTAAFADDIQRFLNDEPVLARPPTTVYRTKKFFKKHRIPTVAGLGIALTLILGAVISTLGFLEVKTARIETELALATSNQNLANANFALSQARWNENKPLEALEYLDRIAPTYRNLGWNLASQVYSESDLTLFGHRSRILQVKFHPKRQIVASGSYDRTIQLWDAVSGKNIMTLAGHSRPVQHLLFTPSGDTLITGSDDGLIKIWDLENQYRTFEFKTAPYNSCLAVSPDGQRLAIGSRLPNSESRNGFRAKYSVKLIDINTGECHAQIAREFGRINNIVFASNEEIYFSAQNLVWCWNSKEDSLSTFAQCESPVNSLCINPQLTLIAGSCQDGTVRLWDVDSSRQLYSLNTSAGATPNCISFSPDGTLLASVWSNNTCVFWGVKNGAIHKTVKCPVELSSCSFSPNGSRVAVADFKTVKIIDITSTDESRTFYGHRRPEFKLPRVNCVAVDNTNEFVASGGNDKSIKVWNLFSNELVATLKGHRSPVQSLLFHPDGRHLISGSQSNEIIVWSLRDFDLRRQLSYHIEDSNPGNQRYWHGRLALNSGGTKIASISNDNEVSILDFRTGDKLCSISTGGMVRDLSFSPDDSSLVLAESDCIAFYNVETGKTQRTIPNSGIATCFAFSDDERYIAAGRGNVVNVWSVDDFSIVHEFGSTERPGSTNVWDIAFALDNQTLVACSKDSTIKLWDLASGKEQLTLHGHGSEVTCLDLFKGKAGLVSGSVDNTVKIWEPPKVNYSIIRGHLSRVKDVAFNSDSSVIASASYDGTARLWDRRTGNQIRELKGHLGQVLTVAISPDDKLLATGSADHTINVWDIGTGQFIRSLIGHDDAVRSIKFMPDGDQIVSGSTDKTIRIWNVTSGVQTQCFADNPNMILHVAVSPDGTRIHALGVDGSETSWDVESATTVDAGTEAIQFGPVISKSGRWLLTFQNREIFVVDLQFGTTDEEFKSYRKFKGHPNHYWHVVQARKASANNDQFAEEFHVKWAEIAGSHK